VFEVNDVHTVIAESYARIFRQNMFNCGMLAIELKSAQIDQIMGLGENLEVAVDLQGQKITASNGSDQLAFDFEISPFDKALVEAGGWVEYADARY
jgi:3-isopropylmalate/(R)-2-methylmalate dehydratase small subunit